MRFIGKPWKSQELLLSIFLRNSKRFKCFFANNTTISNDHLSNWAVPTISLSLLNSPNNILKMKNLSVEHLMLICTNRTYHSFDNFSKNNMTAIQPRSLFSGKEEL